MLWRCFHYHSRKPNCGANRKSWCGDHVGGSDKVQGRIQSTVQWSEMNLCGSACKILINRVASRDAPMAHVQNIYKIKTVSKFLLILRDFKVSTTGGKWASTNISIGRLSNLRGNRRGNLLEIYEGIGDNEAHGLYFFNPSYKGSSSGRDWYWFYCRSSKNHLSNAIYNILLLH